MSPLGAARISLGGRDEAEGGSSLKTIVLDIADNYGSTYLQVRQVDLYNVGVRVLRTPSEYTAYATTDSGTLPASLAFDTDLPLDGSLVNGWSSAVSNQTNQRLICVYDTEPNYDSIVITNTHHLGILTDRGAKNVKIYVTDSVYTDTTYGNPVTGGALVYDSIFDQHSAVDEADSQTLVLL